MAINSELDFYKHAPDLSVVRPKRIGGILPLLEYQGKLFHYCYICKGWVEGEHDVRISEPPRRKSWHCQRCGAEQLSFGVGDAS